MSSPMKLMKSRSIAKNNKRSLKVQMAGFAGHQGRILRPRRARFYGQKSPVVRDGLNVQLLFSLSPLDHQGIAANR